MNEGFRWNFDDLVEMAVTGQVSQPAVRRGGYVHWPDGVGEVLPGMYGITYNARVGIGHSVGLGTTWNQVCPLPTLTSLLTTLCIT